MLIGWVIINDDANNDSKIGLPIVENRYPSTVAAIAKLNYNILGILVLAVSTENDLAIEYRLEYIYFQEDEFVNSFIYSILTRK